MTTSQTLQFVVGNTYQRLPLSEAELDKTGRHRKIHDWTLYVDIIGADYINDLDALERVDFYLGPSFTPRVFTCHSPVPVTRGNGQRAWRFATRQQTYGSLPAKITLHGTDGTTRLSVKHNIDFTAPGGARQQVKAERQSFCVAGPLAPLRMVELPEQAQFGVELELTSMADVRAITQYLPRSSNVTAVPQYRDAHGVHDGWKVVPDASIVCNLNMPNCTTFELVSPILRGKHGLINLHLVMQALHNLSDVKVNKSMGFHVHIDVSGLSMAQIVKVCQNFIKYEAVMDTFMPMSRRNGSAECQRYFQSNRAAIPGQTNAQKHYLLAQCCSDLPSLARFMNKGASRYYKLNLQNLVTGRQPTLEFRQHSATLQYDKMAAWDNRTVDFAMDALFAYVIKDRALRRFYADRRHELLQRGGDNQPCCEGCAQGLVCQDAQA